MGQLWDHIEDQVNWVNLMENFRLILQIVDAALGFEIQITDSLCPTNFICLFRDRNPRRVLIEYDKILDQINKLDFKIKTTQANGNYIKIEFEPVILIKGEEL